MEDGSPPNLFCSFGIINCENHSNGVIVDPIKPLKYIITHKLFTRTQTKVTHSSHYLTALSVNAYRVQIGILKGGDLGISQYEALSNNRIFASTLFIYKASHNIMN